jgi:hypothetical protein
MKLAIWLATAVALGAVGAKATDLQGVLVDWNCAKDMVRDGRSDTLKRNKSCSLDGGYSRAAYGLITNDKQYFKLDDAGRAWALKLLKDTNDKDNLKVVITGDVKDDVIHVKNMSEL